MTNIGLQKPRTQWLWRFTTAVFIGFALGSCNVKDDVVFEKRDAGDAIIDADSEAGIDSGTAMLDSGSNITESGVNAQDGTIASSEGGIDSMTRISLLPPGCFDESKALSVDECTYDPSANDWNSLSDLIYGIGERGVRVDSKDDCTPPYPGTTVEDSETTPDTPFKDSPCPQICEAASSFLLFDFSDLPFDLSKLVKSGSILFYWARHYYVDYDDNYVFHACPLTCQAIRCFGDLEPQQRPPW